MTTTDESIHRQCRTRETRFEIPPDEILFMQTQRDALPTHCRECRRVRRRGLYGPPKHEREHEETSENGIARGELIPRAGFRQRELPRQAQPLTGWRVNLHTARPRDPAEDDIRGHSPIGSFSGFQRENRSSPAANVN